MARNSFKQVEKGRTWGRALSLSVRVLKSMKFGGLSSVLQELRPGEFKAEGVTKIGSLYTIIPNLMLLLGRGWISYRVNQKSL